MSKFIYHDGHLCRRDGEKVAKFVDGIRADHCHAIADTAGDLEDSDWIDKLESDAAAANDLRAELKDAEDLYNSLERAHDKLKKKHANLRRILRNFMNLIKKYEDNN